jgi:hypothetical protein
MARIDKYSGITGGFRAPLNAAIAAGEIGKVRAVTINASGKVVIGAALGLYVGVICPGRAFAANGIIDVMTDGEIVDFDKEGSPEGPRAVIVPTAGSFWYAPATTGVPDNTATGQPLGWCVELSRLVVRVRSRAV